ncbi:LuxR family transcriptional regulator [Kibdelosporangium persicum]|uniref:Regulatory protein, luxR family n=1 Tax=Kibdelosporangium persicum TaxID=2698649 RepID=A0ABX2FHK5_9PSEU|nr:LuxR C-terminal-related transcriptional regulator [Kibdelosporangium persicum]NRN70887.1 Regulatory protein, luxR family [Kibdelosporangium persicum]
MALTERDRAAATLRGVVDDRPCGRAVLLTGAIGTGKTALLHDFVGHAKRSGMTVLTATASRAETSLPAGVLGQLAFGTELPVHQGFCQALLAMGPAVVAVDDIQFADQESLTALLFLARRLASAQVSLVLTEWIYPWRHGPWFRAEISSHPTFQRLHLPLLSPVGVDKVLQQRAPDRANAGRSHGVTGGNPLLTVALAEGNLTGGGMATCLQRLDPPLARLAHALAVLHDSTHGHAAEVAGVEPRTATDSMELLAATGLVDSGRLRAPDAVLAAMSPDDLSATHARVAEVLYRSGATATDVARHLVAAHHVRTDWAIDVLREAADHALARDDVATATGFLDKALLLARDTGQTAVIQSESATAEWRVNPLAALRRLGDQPDQAARYLLWQGKIGLATRLRTTPDPDLRRTALWLYGPGRADELCPDGDVSNDFRHAHHVLRTEQLDDSTFTTLGHAIAVLLDADQQHLALPRCDELISEAKRRKAPTWEAAFRSHRADIALRLGDLPTARSQAHAVLRMCDELHHHTLLGSALAVAVRAATACGSLDEAAELLARSLPNEVTNTIGWLCFLHARGHYHLAAGDAARAIDDFTTCGRLARAWQLDDTARVPWRADLAEAHHQLGEPLRARHWAVRQLARTSDSTPRVMGISLRAYAAVCERHERVRVLGNATGLLRSAGDRLELSRALTDLSRACYDVGDHSRARRLASMATTEAQAAGAPALLPGHAATDVPRTLTTAERRVAALAALGSTNQQIAERLKVTASTVEQHLTKIYRKLNVSRRTELPSVLRTG